MTYQEILAVPYAAAAKPRAFDPAWVKRREYTGPITKLVFLHYRHFL
jgi:hypothetical protein